MYRSGAEVLNDYSDMESLENLQASRTRPGGDRTIRRIIRGGGGGGGGGGGEIKKIDEWSTLCLRCVF